MICNICGCEFDSRGAGICDKCRREYLGGGGATVRKIQHEGHEQEAIFKFAEIAMLTVPEWELLYHIPNGGARNQKEGAALKRRGVKSGVPDICLPVPRKGFNALYIELKRQDGGKLSKNQEKWLKALNKAGNLAVVADGAKCAIDIITKYLEA